MPRSIRRNRLIGVAVRLDFVRNNPRFDARFDVQIEVRFGAHFVGNRCDRTVLVAI